MNPEDLDVRPYRNSDESAVVDLWTAAFLNGLPWNEPRLVIRRKRRVQANP